MTRQQRFQKLLREIDRLNDPRVGTVDQWRAAHKRLSDYMSCNRKHITIASGK